MAISRSTDGFSTVSGPTLMHGQWVRPLPSQVIEYYSDFSVAASGIPFGWTNTATNGTPTIAEGPVLVQTMGGADNDVSHMYPTSGVFNLVAGKKAWFEWEGKVDKATGTIGQEEVYIGLGTVATTTGFVAADGLSLTVDNFVGFASFDGDANIDAITRSSDSESTEATVSTYVDVTYMKLAWEYDGSSSVKFYKDGLLLATISTNIPTSVPMTIQCHIKAGEAQAKVMTSKRVWFAREV